MNKITPFDPTISPSDDELMEDPRPGATLPIRKKRNQPEPIEQNPPEPTDQNQTASRSDRSDPDLESFVIVTMPAK